MSNVYRHNQPKKRSLLKLRSKHFWIALVIMDLVLLGIIIYVLYHPIKLLDWTDWVV